MLVATDVAARGLHVPSLRCVVNYDLPLVDQDLVHRLGRAGHGHAGFAEAFAFVDPDEADRWKRLARLCELDSRLQKVPAEAMPRELREERKQPTERKKLDPRQKARADKRARRERTETLRAKNDLQAATRGRLRGKQAGKPLSRTERPGGGARRA